MSEPLPDHPDLDQLRRQAKNLLADWRAGRPESFDLLVVHHPQHRTRPADPSALRLADAQLVIARRHGLRSWAALRDEVELRQLSLRQRAQRMVQHAISTTPGSGGTPLRVAMQLLDRDPKLASFDAYTALVAGDLGRVQRRLAADPAWVRTPGGPCPGRLPLHYTTFSRLHRLDRAVADGLLACARALLDAGADVDAGFSGEDTWGSVLRPLYGASGAAAFPEMVELLLDRGARIDDGEALYHATCNHDTRCLELLLARGGDPNGVNVLAHAIDARDPAALRLLLAHGGNANGTMHDGTPLLTRAVALGREPVFLELLLAHGADPNVRDRSGRSAVALARAHAHIDLAEQLLAAGATDDGDAFSAFVAAALAGGRQPPPACMTHADVVAWFGIVQRPDSSAAMRMLDAGMPVDLVDAHAQTALHWAAWRGRASLVDRLLDAGAPIEPREMQFGGTPLGWAVHGSRQAPRDGGDHLAVVARLLRAGADPSVRNARGAAMITEDDDSPIAALLRAAGAPEEP